MTTLMIMSIIALAVTIAAAHRIVPVSMRSLIVTIKSSRTLIRIAFESQEIRDVLINTPVMRLKKAAELVGDRAGWRYPASCRRN